MSNHFQPPKSRYREKAVMLFLDLTPLCNWDLASDLVSFAVTGQLSTPLIVKLSQLTLCLYLYDS